MKLADFYAENPARKHSGEADYGVWWVDGPAFPRYRVSYIQATGEVYAVCHSTLEVEVLGVVPTDNIHARSQIYYRTLDHILDGWADVEARQLSWIRDRLANVGARKSSVCRLCNRAEAGKADVCDACAERVV